MGVNLITAVEIEGCYPDQLLIDAGQDKKTKRWAGFIYRLKGEDIHKLMISSAPAFATKKDAEDAMHSICKQCIDYVKQELDHAEKEHLHSDS